MKSINQNQVERYQNLDFKGYEMLLNHEKRYINDNYKAPCQQIASVNPNKFAKSSILTYFIGQFVLLDCGMDKFLPIYIYTHQK